MGRTVTLTCHDGTTAAAYLAEASSDTAPGIVVIQEWWGVQGQIKSVCDRYAAVGYTAIAPDLYAGKTIPYHDKESASREMNALDYLSVTDEIVRAAARYLAQPGRKLGLTGFCLGGIVAILGAIRLDDFAAASAYYGAPDPALGDASKIRIPFQGHFAIHDHWCTAEDADRLEVALNSTDREYRMYRYDAAHAFANEDSPHYDPALAELAWQRELTFWKEHLGDPVV